MESAPRGRRIYSEEERTGIISRFKSSELSLKEFCLQEKISMSALRKWRHLYDSKEEPKFIELPEIRCPEARQEIELKLPHGIELRLKV